jgi:hypothetical protein
MPLRGDPGPEGEHTVYQRLSQLHVVEVRIFTRAAMHEIVAVIAQSPQRVDLVVRERDGLPAQCLPQSR